MRKADPRHRPPSALGIRFKRMFPRLAIASAGIIVLGAGAFGAAATGTRAHGAGSPKCFGKRPTILGTPHGEVIRGTSHRDVIISFGGKDGVLSREGNDYVCSGTGNDTIHGAEGFNRMNGGAGGDWIDGRRGPGNIVIGGKGADHVEAEGKIAGNAGNDILESYGYLDPSLSPVPDMTHGGTGDDDIYGCGGTVAAERPTTPPGPPREHSWAWPDCYSGDLGNAELLAGGPGADSVFGGGGNDQLRGNEDDDSLFGEDGNDNLDGGPGRDTCEQEAGTGTQTGCP
jgi:Ca2+-binding RTX toxin-like protein